MLTYKIIYKEVPTHTSEMGAFAFTAEGNVNDAAKEGWTLLQVVASHLFIAFIFFKEV